MMLCTTITRVEIYAANLKSLDQKLELEIELSKVDKPELMKLYNPNYTHLLEKFKHLKGAKFEDPARQPESNTHPPPRGGCQDQNHCSSESRANGRASSGKNSSGLDCDVPGQGGGRNHLVNSIRWSLNARKSQPRF